MNRFQSKSLRWLGKTIAIASATLVTSVMTTAARGAIADHPTQAGASSTTVSQLFDSPQFCSSDLRHAINDIIRQPQFATASWGIFVDTLDEPSGIYAYNAEGLLIPASNIKLFTTAAAMQLIAQRDPAAIGEFREELNVINRNSNNARADNLLRMLGGQTQVQAALAPLGIQPGDFVQADGSGLSRSNKVKPMALVTLLKGMYATDTSGLFYASLPVGGVSGTLRNRFKGTPVQGKVHAKTGTLRGVRALSGYLETQEQDKIAFSIVVNQPGQSGRVMLDAIDAMVVKMSQLEACD
jgi:D-alanyl-D-alanine carboxypeptidase/D-alanyl-D-alanine-endopeptidase (penicillin-binding protein 4)